MLSECNCPCCGGKLKYHGRYWKNYYAQKIQIIRGRCTSCLSTHALIPSFSVPGMSVGMAELNSFLLARYRGTNLSEAGQCFIDAGCGADYPEFIHRRMKLLTARLKVIFPNTLPSGICYPNAFVQLAGEESETPVTDINAMCLLQGYNPVCFSRHNILTLREYKPPDDFSHDRPSAL